VNAIHDHVIEQFIEDLDWATQEAMKTKSSGQVGQYGTMQ
jgi:hypothetical protein